MRVRLEAGSLAFGVANVEEVDGSEGWISEDVAESGVGGREGPTAVVSEGEDVVSMALISVCKFGFFVVNTLGEGTGSGSIVFDLIDDDESNGARVSFLEIRSSSRGDGIENGPMSGIPMK